MEKDPVVIVGVARTPMGGFQGTLSSMKAPQLGGVAIQGAVAMSGLASEQINEVIMGCVLPAGLGQAPARQAALYAQLPLHAGCTTVNKVCGSGMKATMLAHDILLAGSQQVMVCGGMESMSNAPYLLPQARSGYRLGHAEVLDHMFFDGLQDSYSDEYRGKLMGIFGENCAREYQFSREAQDDFAIESTRRAQQAIDSGAFDWETVSVTVPGRKGDTVVTHDEQPPKANIDKIRGLKPAFSKEGTVTAANSSSISDGGAALVVMQASTALSLGLAPIARILGHASHAHAPELFPTAPVGACQKLLQQLNWQPRDVDLWEINEAFAVVTMVAMKELGLDHARVNIHGGACALGHPIGASGARILVSLLGALKKTQGQRGIASLCIGGGEATAIAVEML